MEFVVAALAFLGGLFTAWAVGVNSSSVFGPVNAAGASTVFQGSLVVGVASFLGAVTQGGNVASTLGRDLLTVDIGASSAAVILLTASVLIAASTLMDIPMPAAFLVVGGTLGAGIAAGGSVNIATARTILIFWLLIPFAGLGIGYLSARLVRRFMSRDESRGRTMKMVLLVLGTYTAYTAGANRAGLPVGPLMDAMNVSMPVLLAFAGLGMVLGAWTGSPRVIKAVSRDYSRMGPRRAVGALLSAGLIAQAATLAGVPISFNQTVIFSVVGSGLVEGSGGVGTRKIARTVGAWVLALGVSSSFTFLLVSLIT